LLYAIIVSNRGGWDAGGWFRIDHGKCQTVIEGNSAVSAYFSILEYQAKVPSLWPIGAKGRVNSRKGSYSTGVEEAFCVKADAFRFSKKSLDAHRSCAGSKGFHLQIFNLRIEVDSETDFTLNLK
jgi:uncharacterized membrane protein